MVSTGELYALPQAATLDELWDLAARLDRETEHVPAGSRSARMSELGRQLAVRAARIMYRRELTAETEAYALDIPLQRAWALARALSGDPARGFSSFSELLATIGAGPAPRPVLRSCDALPAVPRRRRATRIPMAFLLAGIVLLVALGSGLLSRRLPRPLREPALLVGEGTSVTALARDGRPRARLEFGERVRGVTCDRDTLSVSLPDSERVARISLATGQRLSDLAVGPGAGSLWSAPDGAWLAVAFPEGRQVKLWLRDAAGPAASALVAGNPSSLTGTGRSLFVLLRSGQVLELAVPSLRQLSGAPVPPPFPPLTRTWWPGPASP